MCSKFACLKRSCLAAVAIAVLFVSCSLPLNEEPAKSLPPEAKLGFDKECLNNSLPILKAFVNGSALPSEVSATWACFGNAVDLFNKKVKGEHQDYFAPRELARFFEDYFLTDVHVNDRLLTELMRFKQILIGGSVDKLTRDELHKLMDFIKEAQGLSLELLPYMAVYSKNWTPQGARFVQNDIEHFNEANLEIQKVAKILGDRIANSHQDYEIANFVVLLEELEKLNGGDWSWLEEVRKALPLVEKLKKSLVGGNEHVIRAEEWRRFGLLGARGFIQYLRYEYFLKNVDTQSGATNDVVYIIESVDDLFSYLGDMVREKPGGVFTKGELLEILESLKALFPKVDISPALVDEVMKLKQVFFGGSADQFIPEEFEKARQKLEAFRGITEKAYGFLPLYTMNWKPGQMTPEQKREYFRQAEANLEELAARLGQILETQYDLNNLSPFAHELAKLFTPDDPNDEDLGQKVDRYLPLLISAKNIILNDQNSIILRPQWSDGLKTTAEIYCRYLYYRYFLDEEKSWSEGAGLKSLNELVGLVTDSVEGLLKLRAGRQAPVIRLEETDRLLTALEKSKLLAAKYTADILKPLSKALVQKFLVRPDRRLSGVPQLGIDAETLLVIRTEFGGWVEGQNFINRVFQGQSQLSGSQIMQQIDAAPTTALQELKMTLTTPIDLAFDENGRIFFSPLAHRNYDRKSLWKMNLSRAAARLVMNGYAQDLARIQSYGGVTKEEANAVFADAKPIAVVLELIDADNTTFIDSRFLEANLFTPHADGDALLSFREGVDIILMIFSGISLGDEMEQHLRQGCQIVTAKLPRDERVPMRCLLDVYRRDFRAIFTSMPEFSRFADAQDNATFDSMVTNFLKATGWKDDHSGNIRFGDLGLIPHVIQYTEATMMKFDTSKDGILDKPEAMNGYPLFRETLRKFANSENEKVLRGGFSYLLVYGKSPETLAEKLQFITKWVNEEETWPISVNRKKLADVLGYIADAVNKAPKAGVLK